MNLLTPAQVADKLQMSTRWVRQHAAGRKPKLPGIKLGTSWRFRQEVVEKFLLELEQQKGKAA